MIIKFMLNEKQVSIDIDPGRKLADVLREEFNLLSIKDKCISGRCGACTVLKNGRPVPACRICMFTIKNCSISTFEKIKETKKYKILEKSLSTAGCSFCDFCFHGKMVTIYSIMDSYSELTDDVIHKALSGNICGCTDFPALVKGIKLAAATLKRGLRAERN